MAASASCCQDNSFHSSSMIVVNVQPRPKRDHVFSDARRWLFYQIHFHSRITVWPD
jgi:hypothetical protein